MYRVVKPPPWLCWGAWRETYEVSTSLPDIDDVKRVVVDFFRKRSAIFDLEWGDTLVFVRGSVFWSIVSICSERMLRQVITCTIEQVDNETIVRVKYKVFTSLFLHVAENYLLRDIRALEQELDATLVSLGLSPADGN